MSDYQNRSKTSNICQKVKISNEPKSVRKMIVENFNQRILTICRKLPTKIFIGNILLELSVKFLTEIIHGKCYFVNNYLYHLLFIFIIYHR